MMGRGAHDHGTFRSPTTPSPTFNRSKDSSIYPLFVHILAPFFALFCTQANSTILCSSNSVLCANERGFVVTSTPYSPDRLELSTASDVAVLGDQRQALGQGGRANEAVAGITGIIRGKLVGQDGNFHGDGPDCSPRGCLLDEGFNGSCNVQTTVSCQPCQFP